MSGESVPRGVLMGRRVWASQSGRRRLAGIKCRMRPLKVLVRDGRGGPHYFIAQVQDVTERRRAEEALRASEERLRQSQKLEAVGQLGPEHGGRIGGDDLVEAAGAAVRTHDRRAGGVRAHPQLGLRARRR